MKAIRIHKPGGVDVLQFDEKVDLPKMTSTDVLVRVAFSGVNYIDTYHRSGLYKVELPFTLGREGSGIVEKVGSEVKEVKVGDRVGFLCDATYAEYVSLPASRVIPLPSQISLKDGAAALLQGLTSHYLSVSTYPIKQGDTVLIHAGAGGVGQILIQIAKLKGAKVITTVGSREKELIVRELGADEVILYTQEDFLQRVKTITNGNLCNVVYDGVGKDTFASSMKCVGLLGSLVLFGNSSGKVPPIDPLELTNQGSITLVRPSLMHYITTPKALHDRCSDLFGWMIEGKVKLSIGKIFSLSKAGEAHSFIESRKSSGKILLAVDEKLGSAL